MTDDQKIIRRNYANVKFQRRYNLVFNVDRDEKNRRKFSPRTSKDDSTGHKISYSAQHLSIKLLLK